MKINQKLKYSSIVVFLFIVFIAVAGGVGIRILKKTSQLTVVEFIELEALQNVIIAVSEIKSPVQTYLITWDDSQQTVLQARIASARVEINECLEVLTDRHDRSHLEVLLSSISKVEALSESLFMPGLNHDIATRQSFLKQLTRLTDDNLYAIHQLLSETKEEVKEYARINDKAILYSTILIIVLVLILTLLTVIGSITLTRRISFSRKALIATIQRVAEGDLHAKTDLDKHDEFSELASAFDVMLDRLDKLTVSRDHYDRILNSMFNGLIVSDLSEHIISLNEAACHILGNNRNHLIGTKISSFIELPEEVFKVSDRGTGQKRGIQNESILINHQGNKIPVLVSISELAKDRGEIIGIIIVLHDLTQQKEIERQMEFNRKDRSMAIIEGQENERHRIASDLHDGIIQMLTSVSFSLNFISREMPVRDHAFTSELSSARDQITTAINECRRISHNLIPLALHDFGFVPAITALVSSLNNQCSVRFHFQQFNVKERFDIRYEKVLYRICQESINNIIKHSNATNAYIQLIRHSNSLVMVIEDDGVGFDPESLKWNNTGIGLDSIRERVELIGGSLTINSSKGRGTELTIDVPCKNNPS